MKADPTSLESLHDVVTAAPAPFWPPAVGWWWVMAFMAVGGVLALMSVFSWWQRNRYRGEALAEWRRCAALLENERSCSHGITGLAALMKRVALSVSPREEVASLTGAAWTDFLEQTGGGKEAGEWLEQVSYDPRKIDKPKALEIAAQVETWIRLGDGLRPSPTSQSVGRFQHANQKWSQSAAPREDRNQRRS